MYLPETILSLNINKINSFNIQFEARSKQQVRVVILHVHLFLRTLSRRCRSVQTNTKTSVERKEVTKLFDRSLSRYRCNYSKVLTANRRQVSRGHSTTAHTAFTSAVTTADVRTRLVININVGQTTCQNHIKHALGWRNWAIEWWRTGTWRILR